MTYQPHIPNRISTTSFNSRDAATLAAGATFQGVGEDVSKYGRAGISIISDNATDGVLTIEVSRDNVTWGGPTRTFANTSIAAPHMWNIVEKYFRIKYVNGTTEAQNLAIQVQYSNNADILLGHQLNETLLDETEAIVTRSVLVGKNASGAFIDAAVTDHLAIQVTPPAEGKSAYGESLVANLAHEIILDFNYNVNALLIDSRANQSGTVTQADAMAVLQTGAAANSSASLQSAGRSRYQPGQGTRARFTSLFTTGVANSTQMAGIGDESNGFFFGYNGTAFGVLHRKNGSPEIRTLTVTTGSSHAEDITITLDGDAATDVSVTNTGDTTLTANEIAAHDYSDIGRGWTADAVGATVIFTSWNAASRTGTYSLSSATSAIGTFAQTVVGAAPTDTWVAQASWNGADKFDGNGLTGVTLDPTKINVFQVSYQWLGAGAIKFYIQDPDDGDMHLVHTIAYANANTTPSLSIPSLPLCVMAENTSNTSNLTVKTSSMGAFTEGDSELIGPRRGKDASVTLGATSAETPFLTLRNKNVYQSKVNTVPIKILIVSASAEHSKPVEVAFYANATLTGASFSDYSTATSVLETDTSATAFTGGTFLFSIPLGKTGQGQISLQEDRFAGLLTPGNTFTATIKPKSGNAAEATVAFNFVELF
jgi:hypothetical protein